MGGAALDQPFPAYQGDEPYIFVCYAHDDTGVVFPEIQWLHDQGVNVWYDEGISAGKVSRAEIAEAIQGAAKFLYYISAASMASEHCSREVNYALDRGFEVLPVYLEEVDLTPELDLALNRVQALHRDPDASYQQHLLNALDQARGEARSPIVPAQQQRPWAMYAGLGLIAAVLIGVGSWYGLRRAGPDAVVPETAAVIQPSTPAMAVRDEKPSIAVLAFDNLSADPDQQYFTDGMVDEIISRLSRNSNLSVIARNSSFSYRGKQVKIHEIGEELGARYIVEGSVRKAGNRTKITAQLIDATTESLVWAETYESELEDIFSLQDEIAQQVVAALNVEYCEAEMARVRRRPTNNLTALGPCVRR